MDEHRPADRVSPSPDDDERGLPRPTAVPSPDDDELLAHAPVTAEGDAAARAGQAERIRGGPGGEGAALCLSGGGYKAMLFHAGAMWRLNQARLLHTLDHISTVSGGSIAAGILARSWDELASAGFRDDAYRDIYIARVRRLAGVSIDIRNALLGIFVGAGRLMVRAYQKHADLGDLTLQSLPERPNFCFNATNLLTGRLWRFEPARMGEYTTGYILRPRELLATAVAASAAFPPVLSPVVLKPDRADWSDAGDPSPRFPNAAHRGRIVLTDGGVYENMGLESAWKNHRTVFVSDGGGGYAGYAPHAADHWLNQFWQVFWIQRQQVGALRRRQLIASYQSTSPAFQRRGTYWAVQSSLDGYTRREWPEDRRPIPCDPARARELADHAVDLRAKPGVVQERLMNWGYLIADAALRCWVLPRDGNGLPPARPPALPYPATGV